MTNYLKYRYLYINKLVDHEIIGHLNYEMMIYSIKSIYHHLIQLNL